MNCNYKENPGILVKGMRGRGKGMDIETLQKPLPLVRGRDKGMACFIQGLPLLITTHKGTGLPTCLAILEVPQNTLSLSAFIVDYLSATCNIQNTF